MLKQISLNAMVSETEATNSKRVQATLCDQRGHELNRIEGLSGGGGGGGPHVGCQLKFHYFVGCQLKFSIFVGCR